ncbi:nitronate monooxygenase [Roseiarcus fermentans]|uniref:Nitronate monooxygenase n=1 Tax=Roseiarcus fermentans TaxID=1473586 RepID=A0A366F5G2_9HYPH|nr:nitronate monooxygenase family protein [Roseiarcus fermentans]RBP09888.1 nitronate monooxygenase [Roseiarcus fermentans]
MVVPAVLAGRLRLPVIAAPMFLVSGVDLVAAQCCAGVVGAFPALNARPQEELDAWLSQIEFRISEFEAKTKQKAAPYAVNLIVHPSNKRLEQDLATCVSYEVPIVITSLSAPDKVVEAVHGYGGIVLHDVVALRHAKRAAEAGVDGLILVCAGAGGHGGTLNPFAFVNEVKSFYDGIVVLAGAMSEGGSILAARAIGADLAYLGTRFIASQESMANPLHKQMLVEATSADILYTPLFSGAHGNYLVNSIVRAGLDLEEVRSAETRKMNFATGGAKPAAWKDIWSAGQGAGNIKEVLPTAEIVERLAQEYEAALRRLRRWEAA